MDADGAIAERVRGIIPITWDALSKDARYSEALLRGTINAVKESVFGEVVEPGDEENYPLAAIDYAAKLAVIDLCSAGIDFWMNEPQQESATGTQELHTFYDRPTQLRELRKELLQETRQKEAEIRALVGYRRLSGPPRAAINTYDDPFITPSPQEFPRPYVETDFT